MKRSIALLLIPAVAAAQLPSVVPPTPRVPDYTPPGAYIEALAKGRAWKGDEGGVCYDNASHLRVVLSLKMGQRLSDDRAKLAWRLGWLRATSDAQPIYDAEHESLLRAEAQADVNATRATAAEEAPAAGPPTLIEQVAPFLVAAAFLGAFVGGTFLGIEIGEAN